MKDRNTISGVFFLRMIQGKKKAFSLTELLIVIVIIALLFAAMAPIITKRHISEITESESIWNFVANDSERNAFFDPGVETWTSSIYIGTVPPAFDNDKSGKLVINSSDVTYTNSNRISRRCRQPQIQFRFSGDTVQQGRGINTANLLVLPDNIYFGTDPSLIAGSENTIYGISILPEDKQFSEITAFGAYSLGKAQIDNNSNVIALGNRAGYKYKSSNSEDIFIGSDAGAGSSGESKNNTAIGYHSMSNNNNSGKENVFIGAYTGNGFTNETSSYNTIVGSTYYGTLAARNTILGYGVYTNGDPASQNLTAIGYNSCKSIGTVSDGTKIICIGAHSAESAHNSPSSVSKDGGEHIFIGGTPNVNFSGKGFPGRSVLEVHNTDGRGNVILNSNLVVRGNFYPSNSSGKVVYNKFAYTQQMLNNSSDYINAETPYYRCSSDTRQDILSYKNVYVCNNTALANPKSANALIYGGDCTEQDGYPKGNGCPNIISSDKRLKTNITENFDGLDKIEQLIPYNYTYKSDKNNTPQVGVIAQDLQKVFPNSVSKNKKGFLQIRWDEMFYAMINSLKQLDAKINEIAQKISDISKDIISIKNKQNDIQKEISELNTRINRLERK